MTPKELIEILKTLPPDARLVTEAGGDASGYYDFSAKPKEIDVVLDFNTSYGGPHYDLDDVIFTHISKETPGYEELEYTLGDYDDDKESFEKYEKLFEEKKLELMKDTVKVWVL